MRLLRFDFQNKRWIQLFSDSQLDRFKNLSDLPDKEAAQKNLGLYDKFYTKDDLRNGTYPNTIHSSTIIQDEHGQLLSQADRTSWNNKVDKPLINNDTPDVDRLTEGQYHVSPSTGNLTLRINGQLRDFGIRTKTGRANFAGAGREVKIEHGCLNGAGEKLAPRHIEIQCITNPSGGVGETWVHSDETYVYIGNGGSYTGAFDYTIFY
nr:MAG TPA: hypothetical protein [Caudoviricetes sp.]